MGDREALKTFWQGFSEVPSIETMMLNKNAEAFDENDRKDIWTSLPDLTGLRVVEIGSGIGRFTAALASVAKHVLATDFVQSFIEKNQENNGHLGNVSFKCADAAHLDLEPENCDLVFTNWLLMYLTDIEVVHFLQSVLRWLTPNGYLHFRESCSESSKRTSAKSNDNSNPTHYRHICQYLALLDQIRIRDGQSGRLMKFEVLWAKSVETYIRRPSEMVIPNWRQIHMLLRKVWAEDKDSDSFALDDSGLVRVVSADAIQGKANFEREMKTKIDLWGARSPLEQFVLQCLQEKTALTSTDKVLTVFGNAASAISPFSIAETFGCHILDLNTSAWMYDYNLAQANAKGDKRLRFQYVPAIRRNTEMWIYVPNRHFDMIIACMLGDSAGWADVLQAVSEKVKPGGRVVLLERFDEKSAATIASFNSRCSGYGTVETLDVTNTISSFLAAAITQLDRAPELQELQCKYQNWLKPEEDTKWFVVSIQAK